MAHTCRNIEELEIEEEISLIAGFNDLNERQWFIRICPQNIHGHAIFINVNYCPFCGEKLKK